MYKKNISKKPGDHFKTDLLRHVAGAIHLFIERARRFAKSTALLGAIAAILCTLLPPGIALATDYSYGKDGAEGRVTATHDDAAHITVVVDLPKVKDKNGKAVALQATLKLTDDAPWDPTFKFEGKDLGADNSYIQLGGRKDTSGDLHLSFKSLGGGDNSSVTLKGLAIDNPDKGLLFLNWVNGGQISDVNGHTLEGNTANPNNFVLNDITDNLLHPDLCGVSGPFFPCAPGSYINSKCSMNLDVNASDKTKGKVNINCVFISCFLSDKACASDFNHGVKHGRTFDVGIGNPDNAKIPAGTGGVGGPAGSGAPNCELTGTNALSWIICPAINMLAAFADFVLESFIVPFLENIPISTDPNSGIFAAWSAFRVIANILLVGILLVAVIGGAISGGGG